MKKKLLFITLLLIEIISCKPKDALRDYIERGFYSPMVKDSIKIIPQNVSDKGVAYVPSSQDINIFFKLENTYNIPLKVNIMLPEEKKYLFEKLPVATKIEAKMIELSFMFKGEAEPKISNNFLGETVPIEVVINNKESGREFYRFNFSLNCNTVPLPIVDSSISYDEENDEYTIHTPKNDGIHSDLKELVIELSSEKEEQSYKETISIANTSEQDKDVKLNIKSLLSKVSGKRSLKLKVKDKAGLISSQTTKIGSKTFNTITLEPSNFSISKNKSIYNGFSPPKIKELYEFFQKEEDWKSLGYKIEYDVRGTPFTYDAEKKLFFNKEEISVGTFPITIRLKQPQASDAVTTWSVTITAKNDTSLATENGVLIKDVTLYPNSEQKELKPLNDITSLAFTSDPSGIKIANCDIDYTDFETDLTLSLKPNDDGARIGKEGATKLNNRYEKRITLNKEAGSINKTSIILKAENDEIQKYKIIFRRKPSAEVTVKLLINHSTCTTDKAKVESEWDYGKVSTKVSTSNDKKSFLVAKGKNVNFNIKVPEEWEIESVASNLAPHGLNGGTNNTYELSATDNFTLTVKIKPQVVVSWTLEAGGANGKFDIVAINGITQKSSPSVAKKGSNAVFNVSFNNGYQIKEWILNRNKIIRNTPKVSLSNDGRTLTIKDIQTDVVVSVSFREDRYKVKWETPPPAEGHVQVTVGSEVKSESPIYVKKGTEVSFKIFSIPKYKFKGWTINGQEKTENTLHINVTEDIEVKAKFVELFGFSLELDSNVPEGAKIQVSIIPPGETKPTLYTAEKGKKIEEIKFESGSTIILKANENYKVTDWKNQGASLLSLPWKNGSIVNSEVTLQGEKTKKDYKLKVKMEKKD
jgi:hypothetical protein